MASLHKFFMRKSRGYAGWHKKIPLFIITHWGVFLIIAVVTAISLSNIIQVSVDLDAGARSVSIIIKAPGAAHASPTPTPTPKKK